MKKAPFVVLSLLGILPAHAIKIELRYDYDSNGFFNQPGAKQALRAVANYYESLLQDTLLPINPADFGSPNSWSASFTHPGTGSTQTVAGLVVPQNTLIVYVGGRNLGNPNPAGVGGPGGRSASGTQAWLDRIKGRGQAGALATPATDFSPWGGVIAFNTNRSWDFSLDAPQSGTPFVSIALHEFGHVLGIGTADSWTAKISGSFFTGASSVASFGGNVPVSGTSHWQDDGGPCVFPDGHNPDNPNNVLSKAYGIFGTPHGFPQIALMDPSSCSVGPFFKVMTDLDLCALRDIGWQLQPPLRLFIGESPSPNLVFLTWPSTTGVTYYLQKSTTLAANSWTPVIQPGGDGSMQSYNASITGSPRAFFRLNTTSSSALQAPIVPTPASEGISTLAIPEVLAEDCRCGDTVEAR